MWTCPRCGEQHGGQFTGCWKCAGAAEEAQFSATPMPPLTLERKLRPFRFFVVRAIIAFAVGVILSMLFANVVNLGVVHESLHDLTLAGASVLSLFVGLALGAGVGLFVWVLFPYEPLPVRRDSTSSNPS